MTPFEKYNEEKDELKAARMGRILSAAFDLFSVKGIDNVAMTDIAKKAEIGVASLYRYYETKDEIAIRTIIWSWKLQKDEFIPFINDEAFKQKTGIEQLKTELEVFPKILQTQPAFLRFIYFFDSYAVRTQISKERLADYEKMILSIQEIVVASIKKGIEDGTISEEYKNSEDVLYFALTHTMFSAAQKLSLSADMLQMDSFVNGAKNLQNLLSLLLKGIKK